MSGGPRPSATVCVLYQGKTEFEVLMVRRSETARFMAGAWVFPGGVVDPEDHRDEALSAIAGLPIDSDVAPWLAAAFREVVEETGVWLTEPPVVALPGDESVFAIAHRESRQFLAARAAYFANWITPTMIPARFDARFFLVGITERVVPEPDRREIDKAEFVTPGEALRRAETGEWLVPFPTQRTLHQLLEFASVESAIDEWQHREVIPVQPRIRIAADGSLEVVMPGESGFDDLDDADPDPDALARAARASAEKGRPIAEASSDD